MRTIWYCSCANAPDCHRDSCPGKGSSCYVPMERKYSAAEVDEFLRAYLAGEDDLMTVDIYFERKEKPE